MIVRLKRVYGNIDIQILRKELSRNQVRSTNVYAFYYDPYDFNNDVGNLYIQFKKKNTPGDIYVYKRVPRMIYQRLVTIPSKGHYVYQYIKGKFKCEKL